MRTTIVLVILTSVSIAQQSYRIPFASKGNTVELTVANTSSMTANEVSVEASTVPTWINFSQKKVGINQLKANEEKSATLSFAVDKTAPVNKEEKLTFLINSKSGESWTKEIKIQVSPPEKFELFQNYPNPFNPTTTICYQLTKDSRVNLKVYNVLGQEVATLVDEHRQAGYHQEMFDATRHASGMYIYRIVYTIESGKQATDRKTMMVVK